MLDSFNTILLYEGSAFTRSAFTRSATALSVLYCSEVTHQRSRRLSVIRPDAPAESMLSNGGNVIVNLQCAAAVS